MTSDLDNPTLLRIHGARLIQRDIDQLLGICEFALQDGMIDQAEAESILAWLDAHRACLDTWPANVLYTRLRRMLADGALDDQEQGDLLGLVLQIAQPRTGAGTVVPSALPLDAPPPPILFEGRNFCFTGVFDFGTRADCQAAVADRGGICLHGITKKLHYLIIGNVGSETWRHSSFGTKIARAVDYRESGRSLAIVTEDHWTTYLK
jgi:NAD-dependent DNA ligase